MKTIKVNITNALGKPSSATIPTRVVQSLLFIVYEGAGVAYDNYPDLKVFFQEWVNSYNQTRRKHQYSIRDSESLLMAVMSTIESHFISLRSKK